MANDALKNIRTGEVVSVADPTYSGRIKGRRGLQRRRSFQECMLHLLL